MQAFSLVEVILAMGVLLITVISFVGLLGPAMKSVSEVEKADEVVSVVESVNAFLNESRWIDYDQNDSRFESIYQALEADGGFATILVFRWYDNTNKIVRQEIGFQTNEGGNVHPRSVVGAERNGIPKASFDQAVSPIYRVVLTASSSMLLDEDENGIKRVAEGAKGSYPRYTLTQGINGFDGDYLALEVRIFVEDRIVRNANILPTNMANLADEEPLFAYDMAIIRN